MYTLKLLEKKIIRCKLCPQIVKWRKEVATKKVYRFKDWNYWGKPVPSFGPANAELLVVGLAPAAHGANRTGRMFTGDRSGEWLFRELFEFGFCNKPFSVKFNDNLIIKNCRITAALHCTPPKNKPMMMELNNCRKFLLEELNALKHIKVIVTLGKIAYDSIYKLVKHKMLNNKIKFSHEAEVLLVDSRIIICSYHPSQQNTFTGKLTRMMFKI